jgi:predicted nucleic acid-binding protein
MTVKAILDTDILSEYLKGHDAVVARRAEAYARDHGVFTFTSVTVYEIVYGLELKGASSQLKKVRAWLTQNIEITPVGADYLAAASIKATARKQAPLSNCQIV